MRDKTALLQPDASGTLKTEAGSPRGRLPYRHHENPREPQQHLAVLLRQIGAGNSRGVLTEKGLALRRLERISLSDA